MNPEYVQLAQLAYDTVLAVMVGNEAKHPDAKWKTQDAETHEAHALLHLTAFPGTVEDVTNALTRCAMALHVHQSGAGQ